MVECFVFLRPLGLRLASSHMLVSRTKPCMPQNHCIAGICAWLITSDAICRKTVAVHRINWIPWRNARLIHESQGVTQSRTSVLGALQMNEIKTNAQQWAATPSSVESIHLVRKPIYRRILTNNCPISHDGRVVDCHGVDGSGGLGFDSGEGA